MPINKVQLSSLQLVMYMLNHLFILYYFGKVFFIHSDIDKKPWQSN